MLRLSGGCATEEEQAVPFTFLTTLKSRVYAYAFRSRSLQDRRIVCIWAHRWANSGDGDSRGSVCIISFALRASFVRQELDSRMNKAVDNNLELEHSLRTESEMDQVTSKRAQDKLEQRVKERTSQLSAINAQLIDEITERERPRRAASLHSG